jgi:hemin uptake protein HemP
MIIIIVNNLLYITFRTELFYQKEFTMSMVISRYLNCRENRLPTLQSQHLFALTKEVRIEHEGEEYRLRLTRNNRLILTK